MSTTASFWKNNHLFNLRDYAILIRLSYTSKFIEFTPLLETIKANLDLDLLNPTTV